MPKRTVVLAAGIAAVFALAACGNVSTEHNTNAAPSTSSLAPGSAPGTRRAPSSGAKVTIMNFGYELSGSVTPGAKVAVTNKDNVAHTVTSDAGNLFNLNIPPGGTASFTAPAKPGTYAFHCIYHGNMHGSLVVK